MLDHQKVLEVAADPKLYICEAVIQAVIDGCRWLQRPRDVCRGIQGSPSRSVAQSLQLSADY